MRECFVDDGTIGPVEATKEENSLEGTLVVYKVVGTAKVVCELSFI